MVVGPDPATGAETTFVVPTDAILKGVILNSKGAFGGFKDVVSVTLVAPTEWLIVPNDGGKKLPVLYTVTEGERLTLRGSMADIIHQLL